MVKRYLLGVDLGTTATKAALYLPDGTTVAHARSDVPIHHLQSGWVDQDPRDFYRTAAEAVRECIAASAVDPAEIACIAFDSQMAGVGTIDEDFEPATRFDSWLDMRCQPYVEQLRQHHAQRITQLTGCPPTCNHGPKILWWQHERPQDYARIVKFVMPSSYVAGRLVGQRADEAYIDNTFLHFTALADAERGCWSDELCSTLGVDRSRLPRIVSPTDIVGEVTELTATEFGLAPGTPVAAGCGDTAAGALGAGIVAPGMLLDVAGTASVFACCTDRFVADQSHGALITMRSVVPGLWNPLAYIGGGGLALRWIRDQFAGSSYEEMLAVAATAPPGCDGLLFSPHLGGRICPATPEMRGAWTGFSWNHTAAHFYRAVAESVAYEYSYYVDILRELLPDLRLHEVRVIGGGAESSFWNHVKADVLQIPYVRVQNSECATWGCALIAGAACGLIRDLAGAALKPGRACPPIAPNREHASVYTKAAQRYRSWQSRLAEGYRDEA